MPLAPEVSIPVAAGVAGIVFSLHMNATPPITDVRTSTPGSMPADSVNRARRQATWLSIGLVSGISLLSKDATILVVGGSMAVALDWWTRYNNEVYPTVGKVIGAAQAAAARADAAAASTGVEPGADVSGNPYGPQVSVA